MQSSRDKLKEDKNSLQDIPNANLSTLNQNYKLCNEI
jgi:hypothetical protein